MELTFLIIFGVILIAGFFLLNQKIGIMTPKTDERDKLLLILNENLNATTKQMMAQMNDVRRQVDLRLKENAEILQKSNKAIGERLDGASKAVLDVKSNLSKLEEANKRIYDVGKDIATLQEILQSPKLRGNLGEQFLEDLLTNLPKDMYEMQYSFKNGKKVDAIIRFKDRLVPIDAKFPLENFQKYIATKDEKERKSFKKAFYSDVKKRIDEAAQYVLTDEGTLDFVLLYIPSESIYYEIMMKDGEYDDIELYARKKRVILVSPNNFFAYLQTILMGLRGFQIEKSAKEIQMALSRLKSDFGKFGEEFAVLGTHLGNARNKFETSERLLLHLADKFENIEIINGHQQPSLIKPAEKS